MAETKVVEKKNSKKGWLIGCGIGCGVLLIIAIIIIVIVAGWFKKTVSVNTYLNNTTTMINTVQGELKASTTDAEVSKKKTDFEALAKSSDENLKSLNETKVPKGADQLNANLIEYFTLTKKLGNGLASIMNISSGVEKMTASFKNTKIDNSSFETQANSLRDLKKTLDPIVIEIESMKVPDEIAVTHNSIVTYCKNLMTGLDKTILGSDTKNGGVVDAGKTDMQNALDGIQNSLKLDNLYKTETARTTVLETQIQDEINSLK